jgi:hypothetical protein
MKETEYEIVLFATLLCSISSFLLTPVDGTSGIKGNLSTTNSTINSSSVANTGTDKIRVVA